MTGLLLNRTLLPPALLALALLTGACADTADDAASPDATAVASPTTDAATTPPGADATSEPTATSSVAPSVTPSAPPADSLLALEAYWMCDIQRFTFDELDAVTAELDTRLSSAGFTPDEYDEFQTRLATQPALREGVLAVYRDYCDDATTTEG